MQHCHLDILAHSKNFTLKPTEATKQKRLEHATTLVVNSQFVTRTILSTIWTPNSLCLYPLAAATLEAISSHASHGDDGKHQEILQMIWDSLPQRPIDKAVKKFPK